MTSLRDKGLSRIFTSAVSSHSLVALVVYLLLFLVLLAFFSLLFNSFLAVGRCVGVSFTGVLVLFFILLMYLLDFM